MNLKIGDPVGIQRVSRGDPVSNHFFSDVSYVRQFHEASEPPISDFRRCEHFGKKVVNMFMHNLGVADLDPISKSKFDPFL